MARKPNYDFERREREKAKAAKVAERTKLKASRSAGTATSDLPLDDTERSEAPAGGDDQPKN